MSGFAGRGGGEDGPPRAPRRIVPRGPARRSRSSRGKTRSLRSLWRCDKMGVRRFKAGTAQTLDRSWYSEGVRTG